MLRSELLLEMLAFDPRMPGSADTAWGDSRKQVRGRAPIGGMCMHNTSNEMSIC